MPLGQEIGDIVLDGVPATYTERGIAAPPPLRAMSIVAKRSPISATAELLSNITEPFDRFFVMSEFHLSTTTRKYN